MSRHEPTYAPECAEQVGLDGDRWEVAIDKHKYSGGRRVVVWVRNKNSGKHLVDAAGGRITKDELDRHARRIAIELVNRHMEQD